MKNLIKLMLWLYLKLIRSWKSPLIYWILRITKYRGNNPQIWNKIKDLNINDFHKKICHRTQYDYYLDPLGGALDNSPQQKNFFFREDLTSSRDCAAWARMWYWYHKYHNREVYEIVMLKTDPILEIRNKKPFLNIHMVTVAKVDGKYQLFDYRPINKKADNIKKALNNNLVNYNNFIWNINKK